MPSLSHEHIVHKSYTFLDHVIESNWQKSNNLKLSFLISYPRYEQAKFDFFMVPSALVSHGQSAFSPPRHLSIRDYKLSALWLDTS